jgi:HEPN domain-containing protein
LVWDRPGPKKFGLIDMTDWRHAVEHASKDWPVPLHYLLLTSAYVSYYRKTYDLAVLDAATAADTALDEALRHHRPRPQGKVYDYTLRKLLRDAGVPLPDEKEIEKRLTKPRQSAAHAKRDLLTAKEAWGAFWMAVRIVKACDPLPDHCKHHNPWLG